MVNVSGKSRRKSWENNRFMWSGLVKYSVCFISLSTGGSSLMGRLVIIWKGGDGPGGGRLPLFCGSHCPQPGTTRNRGCYQKSTVEDCYQILPALPDQFVIILLVITPSHYCHLIVTPPMSLHRSIPYHSMASFFFLEVGEVGGGEHWDLWIWLSGDGSSMDVGRPIYLWCCRSCAGR